MAGAGVGTSAVGAAAGTNGVGAEGAGKAVGKGDGRAAGKGDGRAVGKAVGKAGPNRGAAAGEQPREPSVFAAADRGPSAARGHGRRRHGAARRPDLGEHGGR